VHRSDSRGSVEKTVLPSVRNVANVWKHEEKHHGKICILIKVIPVASESLLSAINFIINKQDIVFLNIKYHPLHE
jgi:hypothetical protein